MLAAAAAVLGDRVPDGDGADSAAVQQHDQLRRVSELRVVGRPRPHAVLRGLRRVLPHLLREPERDDHAGDAVWMAVFELQGV